MPSFSQPQISYVQGWVKHCSLCYVERYQNRPLAGTNCYVCMGRASLKMSQGREWAIMLKETRELSLCSSKYLWRAGKEAESKAVLVSSPSSFPLLQIAVFVHLYQENCQPSQQLHCWQSMKNKWGFSTKSLTLLRRETRGQGEKKQAINLYISGTSVQSSHLRAEKIKGDVD